MRDEFRAVLAAMGLACVSLTLTSCGLFHKRVAASRPVPRQPLPPPRTGEAAQPPSATAVWNLRAGLNVAALSCRGHDRRSVEGDYARLLTRHRILLAAAYRQEQSRQGVAAFDQQQTRVYNGFANQLSAAHFCNAASAVAQRANGLDSAALMIAAPRLLGELRASLRYRP